MPDTETTTLAARNAVIVLARGFQGAHYTDGAAGDIPDQGGGVYYRPRTMSMLPNEPLGHAAAGHHAQTAHAVNAHRTPSPVMFAALCNQNHAKICRGRPSASEVIGKPVGNPDDPGHLARSRAYRWPRPADSFAGERVLGESCVGKRHFDCIGFVNYCLSAVTQRHVHFDIAVWDRRALQQLTRPHEQTSRPSVISDTHGVEGHAADLVLRGSHHIGMLTGDGWVIQAQGELRGVMQEHYSPTAWTTLVRLPRAWWTGS